MDTYNKDGHSPLHIAAQFNRGEVVRTLVRLGCDPDMVSKEGIVGWVWEGRGEINIQIENIRLFC